MGSPDFAVPSLEKLIHSRHKVIALITQPDKARGRGKKVTPTPVKTVGLRNHISTVIQPESLSDEIFLHQLKVIPADLYVVVAFRILPESVFSIPPLGTINVHPSLLPKFRGAAPINWAIIRGETETGVTIMRIQKEVDAGAIISQEKVNIFTDETAGSLHDRLAQLGADMLLKAVNDLADNRKESVPQNDTFATPAPKISREDCHLSFDQPAEDVKNWINGLSPFPTAYAYLNDDRINFYKATTVILPEKTARPGTVVKTTKDDLHIACRNNAVRILEMQKQGKKRMPVSEFLKGYRIEPGDLFN